tara:strand:- start:30 stop:449 length:420 start_codon:yes stop_codon:yes gene_type:complete
MIDIDKYEGHTQEDWHFDSAHVLRNGYDKEIAELVGEDWLDDKATQALIEDAPLILQALIDERAEVKRLREGRLELLAEVKRLRKLRDEITNLIRIDEINSKCCICGKAIEVPEGEVWSDGCWECYLEQEPDWREGEEE